ncbi:VanZ family protein [Paenibacillus sp. FSL R5-0407]|uniref:VanZ family protein n=1 Tax=Paenibacillus sp. FSL R5-0407 TaxID=2975320 RepID=UPI0030F83F39
MKKSRLISLVLLIGYSFLLTYWMIWGFGRGVQADYMYNLRPFLTIGSYLRIDDVGTKTWVINLIGNIGVFVPFGVLIPLIWGGRLLKGWVLFIVGVFVLEMTQLLSRRGSFDIDDFILNSFGFLIGCGVYVVLKRRAE